jgi:hypothetical protein
MNYLYGGLLMVGIVLVYFAVKQYNKTSDLLTHGIKTKATVIDLIKIHSDDGYTYKPVFEYFDETDKRREFKSSISSSPAPYKVGEQVKIIYNTDDYDEVKTISYWGLYRWTIILLSIASPLLIIGGGYFLYSKI